MRGKSTVGAASENKDDGRNTILHFPGHPHSLNPSPEVSLSAPETASGDTCPPSTPPTSHVSLLRQLGDFGDNTIPLLLLAKALPQ